jgi:hypothetical protein
MIDTNTAEPTPDRVSLADDREVGPEHDGTANHASAKAEATAEEDDGACPLDDLVDWFGRFIRFTHPDDVYILALWTVHTHLASALYTSPRLMIDSVMPGSGKSTLLDHLHRLCHHPVHAATLTSPAQLTRMLDAGPRTILLDEVDRSLKADRPGVGELVAVLNAGYRVGATRPVLVQTGNNNWETKEMPTFAPVAMAGNSPQLPEDTVSRSIRILLMPDLDDTVEDSDWELIEDHAKNLHATAANWAERARERVKGMVVELPDGCIGRSKEKWRPLKRIAVVAGGRWPAITDRLINQSLAEDAAEHEAGLKTLPVGMVMMKDLHPVWPDGENFAPTRTLVSKLITHNPEYWGPNSGYGKALTDTRFAQIVARASRVTPHRVGGRGPRGYLRSALEPVWRRLGIELGAPGEPGAPGANGQDDHQVHRVNHLHQVEDASPMACGESGAAQPNGDPMLDNTPRCHCGQPAVDNGTLCRLHRDIERENTAISALVAGAQARSNGMEGASR